jgi:hypothetical protein
MAHRGPGRDAQRDPHPRRERRGVREHHHWQICPRPRSFTPARSRPRSLPPAPCAPVRRWQSRFYLDPASAQPAAPQSAASGASMAQKDSAACRGPRPPTPRAGRVGDRQAGQAGAAPRLGVERHGPQNSRVPQRHTLCKQLLPDVGRLPGARRAQHRHRHHLPRALPLNARLWRSTLLGRALCATAWCAARFGRSGGPGGAPCRRSPLHSHACPEDPPFPRCAREAATTPWDSAPRLKNLVSEALVDGQAPTRGAAE